MVCARLPYKCTAVPYTDESVFPVYLCSTIVTKMLSLVQMFVTSRTFPLVYGTRQVLGISVRIAVHTETVVTPLAWRPVMESSFKRKRVDLAHIVKIPVVLWVFFMNVYWFPFHVASPYNGFAQTYTQGTVPPIGRPVPDMSHGFPHSAQLGKEWEIVGHCGYVDNMLIDCDYSGRRYK